MVKFLYMMSSGWFYTVCVKIQIMYKYWGSFKSVRYFQASCSFHFCTWCVIVLMPPDQMIGAYCFCPVCLSVCLSVVNFNLCYKFWTVRDRDFIFGMHTAAYSTYDALSNINKINYLVTLTMTFMLKITFCNFFTADGKVFHKHMYFITFSDAAKVTVLMLFKN